MSLSEINCAIVKSTDVSSIDHISDWYSKEWSIPKERTIYRLSNHPNEDIVLQLILFVNSHPAATGGLYNQVGLHQVYPKYKKLGPWVALIYTDPRFRNQGLGTLLLRQIEEQAHGMNLKELYLFTFTAEHLYKRNGWSEVERVDYHGKDTVIMKKLLE